ncbi:MAG: acetolactate synthase small subunit [Spirochaetales bacterium]|nr:acetolactate synthase small subunit [Spirochaetales bacterium]
MTHAISLLVENHQGVLARISGLFSGRGYNLESLTVGPTLDPTVSRITLVCKGDDSIIEQIKKQLNKLVDIIKVVDMSERSSVDREMALIKITAPPQQRGEICQVADVFRSKVMDVAADTMVLEVTGAPEKINDFIAILQHYNILEIARSGLVSMERGKKLKQDS